MKMLLSITLISLMYWRNNLMMNIMMLEMLMLTMITSIMLINKHANTLMLMTTLTMMVISSSLGLSMITSMARSHKSSKMSNIWPK